MNKSLNCSSNWEADQHSLPQLPYQAPTEQQNKRKALKVRETRTYRPKQPEAGTRRVCPNTWFGEACQPHLTQDGCENYHWPEPTGRGICSWYQTFYCNDPHCSRDHCSVGEDDADLLRKECSAKARDRKGNKKGGGGNSSGEESDGGRVGKGGGKKGKGRGVCWSDQQAGGCTVEGCTFRHPSRGQ